MKMKVGDKFQIGDRLICHDFLGYNGELLNGWAARDCAHIFEVTGFSYTGNIFVDNHSMHLDGCDPGRFELFYRPPIKDEYETAIEAQEAYMALIDAGG
jgi:hypothetical protein